MEKKVFILKKQKASPYVVKSIVSIIGQLEEHGRAITENGKASRFLSYRLKHPKDRGDIFFNSHNVKRERRSVITLKPGVRLVRINDNKIKLIYDR